MVLTNDQEKALKIILEKYKHHEKYVTVCGYAGTGKSTLVKFAIEALGVPAEKVGYACYCGKAAEVLRQKGNTHAMTLHKLLYEHYPREGGGFFRKPRKKLPYKIVVVDEISLAPKSMIETLLTHDVFCIFVGDNFQLPQIDKTEAHDYLLHPDIFLSTIMRQAAESEIIQLTMKIRNNEPIPFMRGNEVIVMPKKELNTSHLLWADAIICGMNSTRHAINKQMRELKGFNDVLQSGEKILIKRNYWDAPNENGDVLVNGMLGQVYDPFEKIFRIPKRIKSQIREFPVVCAEFIPEVGESFDIIQFDTNYLLNEEPCLDWKTSYQISQCLGDVLPRQAVYGYSLTCHAAQGSEWDRVLVIEEKFPYDRLEHARWLYTAATRAASRLVLVR